MVLPFRPNEQAFLEALLARGRVDAGLLTNDEELRRRIQDHPNLAWKALQVQVRLAREASRARDHRHPPGRGLDL